MQLFAYLQKAKLSPFLLIGLAGGVFAQGNDCSSPTVIGPGSHSGSVSLSMNSDFWEMSVPAGQMMTLTETMDTGDTIYERWNVGCSTQFQANWSIGLNTMSWGNTTGNPVTVIVKVFHASSTISSTSNYDFNIAFRPYPCQADSFEDNDICFSAATITPGIYTGLSVGTGDADFYEVDVPDGMRLTLHETLDTSGTVRWRLSSLGCATLPGTYWDTLVWGNATGASVLVSIVADYGNVSGVNCAYYDFDLAVDPDPCQDTPDDPLEENDDCATAFPLQDGTYSDLFVSSLDSDFYALHVRNGSTVTVFMAPSNFDQNNLELFLREAGSPQCGAGWNGGLDVLDFSFPFDDTAFLDWTNSTGGDVDVVLEVRTGQSNSSVCNAYDLSITGSGASDMTGSIFCNPMDANSIGVSTRLTGAWGTGVGSDFHLEVTNGPPTQIGYFLVGTETSDPGLVLSQGRLCLAISSPHAIGRFNVVGGSLNSIGQFDAGGVLQNLVGTSALGGGFDVPITVPIAGSPQIVSGETWHFQLWHRENAGESNFSNGLSVTF